MQAARPAGCGRRGGAAPPGAGAARGAAAAGPRRRCRCAAAPASTLQPAPRLELGADAPHVMVNSCTGRMGHAAAEAVVAAGLTLVPFTLTGYSAGVAVSNIGVAGVPVEVVGKDRRAAALASIRKDHPNLIIVDYTTPYCVNDNAQFYAENGVPFVMGTTGGDPTKVAAAAEAAGVYAVVSPQMGKQVVAFQAMMELMATNFPGVFAGYTLSVVESHQRNKADTSGTAKAVVQSFAAMGLDVKESDIRKVRDRMSQLEVMRVPEESLDGHAFHTYQLLSPDGSVEFVFRHNVTGRSIYAEGTVDAVLFLAKAAREGAEQKVYSMVDVLRAGALR
ncbi:DAPB1 [Scenedesmus sp. PABB004]|nr:DAPB1 [Scenedesmus sp. PABB004]